MAEHSDGIANEETTEVEKAGVLVELDGVFSDLLVELEERQNWVEAEELIVALDLEDQAELDAVVEYVNDLTRSAEVVEKEEDGTMMYRANFFNLSGASIPLGGGATFDERIAVEVVKEVEVPVEVIKEVEKPVYYPVYSPEPEKKELKRKIIKRKPKKQQDDNSVVWAGLPIPIEPLKGYIEPDWAKSIETMLEFGRHIAIEGQPGVGKSTVPEQLACKYNVPLVNISADVGLTRRDLVGFAEIKDGNSWFNVAEYATAVVNGWWVKVDEINAADPDALLFINSQLAPPHVINIHGKAYKVHPDFRLFATYNKGLTGTKMLPQATVDRFFTLQVDYPNDDQLAMLLVSHGAKSEEVIKQLVSVARMLWNSTVRYRLSPRRLYDALLLIETGVSVVDALAMSIIPNVWSAPEVPNVQGLINDGLAQTYNVYFNDFQFNGPNGGN